MQRVGRVGTALVAVTGLVVLVGWYGAVSALTTVLPGQTPMRPNTALGFVALAIAVATLDRRRLAAPLAATGAAVGGATLLEYLLGRSLGIDDLLPGIDAGAQPLRMAAATALCLFLLGIAVISGGCGRSTFMRALAMAAFGVSQVAILGYAYGVSELYTIGGATSMAVTSAFCIALLSLAILVHDPSAGLVGLLRDKGSAGQLLRPLAPFMLLGPPLLGWLGLWAQDQGWMDRRLGVALRVTIMTVLGGALSWRAAMQLRELDRQRDAATCAMDETNRSLEATVSQRTSELADRQSFTDALLDTIEVGILSCDADGLTVVRNRAQRAMIGMPDDLPTPTGESAPRPFDMIDADGKQLTVEQYLLKRTMRGEDIGALELLLDPAGGPHREVIVRGSRIAGRDGAELGAVLSITDLTAERTVSRALDEEHRRLTEAQRIGQLGSFEHDFATGAWTFSDQLCSLWGVAPGGLVPGLTDSLIVEEDRPLTRDAWSEASRLGGHHSYDHRIRRSDNGAERIVRATLEVDLHPDGRPLRVRGTHLDITELTIAEKAAQRANAFFEAVLTATPDYTFVTDLATGEVIYSSPGKDVLGINSDKFEGLGRAATAALTHPDDQPRLRAIDVAAKDLQDGQVLQLRYRGMHTDGQWRWLNRRVTPFRRDDAGRVVEVLGVVRDITDVTTAEASLTHAALHDNLTGLPNRSLLVDRLDKALARSGREAREVAVLFCDLDGFKRVNDTAGHAAGDALLLEIAERLTTVLRGYDTVARVGGDEFVIVIEPWNRPSTVDQKHAPDPDPEADRALAVRVAERVAEAVRKPVSVNGVEHVVTSSIGITYARFRLEGRTGAVTAEQVLQDADAAMYLAKRRGKDRFEVFEHGLRTDLAERDRVEQVLRLALQPSSPLAGPTLEQAKQQTGPTLTAAYQPIFDADTMSLVGFEALARLTDGDGVDIPPSVFIPVAEATGIIHPLGRVMLELVCIQLHSWRKEMPGLEHATMAVNLSAIQAQHSALAGDIRRALTAHHLVPADLVLELTETALLHAAHSTITTLRALHADGVGISIDDFGIGYASLRYLATLPITSVKIDRSFTAGFPHDPISCTIVNAVAGLAADLDLACVVEGVETPDQLDALPNWVRVQGFLMGRPQQPEDLDVRSLLPARML